MLTAIVNRILGRDIRPASDYDVPPFHVHPGWAPFWEGKHRRRALDLDD